MSRDATPYEVFIDERIEKDLEKVPKYITKKFLKLLDEFEKNPIRPRSGFDVKPLEGYPGNTYRLRMVSIGFFIRWTMRLRKSG